MPFFSQERLARCERTRSHRCKNTDATLIQLPKKRSPTCATSKSRKGKGWVSSGDVDAPILRPARAPLRFHSASVQAHAAREHRSQQPQSHRGADTSTRFIEQVFECGMHSVDSAACAFDLRHRPVFSCAIEHRQTRHRPDGERGGSQVCIDGPGHQSPDKKNYPIRNIAADDLANIAAIAPVSPWIALSPIPGASNSCRCRSADAEWSCSPERRRCAPHPPAAAHGTGGSPPGTRSLSAAIRRSSP